MEPKIVYNVTVKIDINIELGGLKWMKESHIPNVMMTGKFISWRIHKILGDDDPNGGTDAIQYIAPDMDTFLDYNQYHAKQLQEEHKAKYKDRYVAFRTLMEIVEESKNSCS